jgi:uncharacterized protein YjbI with pentapeptide repeats
MAKTGIRPPALGRKLPIENARDIEDDAEIGAVAIEGAHWSGKVLRNVELDAVEIRKGMLTGSQWTRARWVDVRCTGCDLSNVEWDDATFARVELVDCRLAGAKLSESRLDHVRFVRCQLSYASLLSTKCSSVAFEDCSLVEAQFHSSDLGGVPFLRCDLAKADFAHAKLEGADVSTSSIVGIRIGAGEVRGLGTTREQAAALAVLLGVRIVG